MIEIQPQFAPISTDARAILRQKTLLGETYVELTVGHRARQQAAPVALGAAANVTRRRAPRTSSRSPRAAPWASAAPRTRPRSTRSSTPSTRRRAPAFQRWQQNAAVAIDGRGLDLNDAFGNLGPFVTDASDIVDVLGRQKDGAEGPRPRHGHGLRGRSAARPGARRRDHRLRQHLRRARLRGPGAGRDLPDPADLPARDAGDARAPRPVPGQHQAAVRQPDPGRPRPLADAALGARALAATCADLFVDLDRSRTAARKGLPALREFLGRPAAGARRLDPFLANLNPVSATASSRRSTTDFLVAPGVALSGSYDASPGDPAAAPRPAQLGYISSESLSI